jgi:hypothetical protein
VRVQVDLNVPVRAVKSYVKNAMMRRVSSREAASAQTARTTTVVKDTGSFFYPSGQKEAKGSYVDGFQGGETGVSRVLRDGREGAWVFWHDNGQKHIEATYLNGTRTSLTEWDANGTQTRAE